MGLTAYSGPLLSFGITTTSTGGVQQYNEERGPSLFDLGQATADPRPQYSYDPGSPVGTQVRGLWDQQGVVDYVPFTAASSAIVLSTGNAPVSGTALTLAPVSSLGAFATTLIAPETGKAVSVVAIDSTAAVLPFGTGGTVALWNPAGGTGRSISVITSCTNTNSEVYIVRGRDMYGFKMTENIIGSTTSSGTGAGKKAFKYIQSVTCSTTVTVSATGVAVGFGDIFGFPIRAPYLNGISVWVSTNPASAANAIALTSANTTINSTIVTQTATTADVRGTYNTSIATNGTSANISSTGIAANFASTGVRITIAQNISPVMAAIVTSSDFSGIFGVTQFSDF